MVLPDPVAGVALTLVPCVRTFVLWQRLGVPGPLGVPVFYNLFDVLSGGDKFYDWLMDRTFQAPPHLRFAKKKLDIT